MPQTVTVYKFSELSEKARERAMKDWRDKGFAFDSGDEQMLTEDFQSRLGELGLPTDVYWSLSCCQGDGVAFYGPIDLAKLIASGRLSDAEKLQELLERAPDVSAKVIQIGSGRYSHEGTMIVEFYDEPDDCASLVKDLIETIQGIVRDVSKELEELGYDDIKDCTSDECVGETLEANDYLFSAKGQMWFE